MRIRQRVLPVLLTFAMIVTWGPWFFCPRSDASAMPCCKRAGDCATGMRDNGCCAIAPAPAAPERNPGQEGRSAGSSLPPRPHPAAIASASWQPPALATTPHLDRLWYPPAHDDSPPVFLRNAAILL